MHYSNSVELLLISVRSSTTPLQNNFPGALPARCSPWNGYFCLYTVTCMTLRAASTFLLESAAPFLLYGAGIPWRKNVAQTAGTGSAGTPLSSLWRTSAWLVAFLQNAAVHAADGTSAARGVHGGGQQGLRRLAAACGRCSAVPPVWGCTCASTGCLLASTYVHLFAFSTSLMPAVPSQAPLRGRLLWLLCMPAACLQPLCGCRLASTTFRRICLQPALATHRYAQAELLCCLACKGWLRVAASSFSVPLHCCHHPIIPFVYCLLPCREGRLRCTKGDEGMGWAACTLPRDGAGGDVKVRFCPCLAATAA